MLLLLLSCFSRVRLFTTHGLQPTRLLHPWDFLGKSTGVACYCLLRNPTLDLFFFFFLTYYPSVVCGLLENAPKMELILEPKAQSLPNINRTNFRGLECKSRKSGNTWSNRQIWPWSMEWAGQRLIEFCQENTLVIANTLFQQHKRRLYTWTSLDGQHWNQIDYILCSQRWRSSIQSAKTRPGADCGSDHELLITKFRLKLKKVGKTTRPFRYPRRSYWKPNDIKVEEGQ